MLSQQRKDTSAGHDNLSKSIPACPLQEAGRTFMLSGSSGEAPSSRMVNSRGTMESTPWGVPLALQRKQGGPPLCHNVLRDR